MNEGRKLAEAGMQAAVDHAERECPGWKERAYEAFVRHAKKYAYFTTEQVRMYSALDVPEPPDRRAWGGVARRAMRNGLVLKDGFVEAVSRTQHSNVLTRFRSLILENRP